MNIKRILLTLASILIIFSFGVSSANASNQIRVTVDNEILSFETSPFIESGTTLVPMRKIFEALNLDVQWVNETKQIIATDEYNCIVLTIGSNAAQRNGQEIKLSVEPRIVSGSTYVPVRFIAESLDSTVDWDKDSQTVIIKSKANKSEPKDVFEDYIPYSTSDTVTLVRNILNGDVVYFNGQYWATPDYANRISNEVIIYENDVSTGSDTEANERSLLPDSEFEFE